MHALSRLGEPVRCFASRVRPRAAPAAMGSSSERRDPSTNPTVGRLRELFQGGDKTDGWEKSWQSGITPWDLGKPTPIIDDLVKSGTLPNGRALVPGCGMGYDVVALASPERFVVGLDISDMATEKAKQWSSSLPNADCFTFLAADFFKWTPSEQFDLIFDYTDQGGPPYNNTVADYQKVLEPLGFKAALMEDNELAIKPRKAGSETTIAFVHAFEFDLSHPFHGREKLGRWKRCRQQSSL